MTQTGHDPWSHHGPDPGSSPSTLTRTPPAGWATAAGRPERRSWRRWVVFAVLVVLAAAALVFGLVRCDAQSTSGPAPSAPSPAAPQAGAPPAGGAGAADAAAAGSLTAGATSVFDAARSGALARLAGQTAIARAVPVQSVVADEGFWIGSSETDRVWVQLTSDDESPVTIVAGQVLDMSGPVVSHGADFAGKAGVTADEGAVQLTREGAHLEIDPNQITVAGTR